MLGEGLRSGRVVHPMQLETELLDIRMIIGDNHSRRSGAFLGRVRGLGGVRRPWRDASSGQSPPPCCAGVQHHCEDLQVPAAQPWQACGHGWAGRAGAPAVTEAASRRSALLSCAVAASSTAAMTARPVTGRRRATGQHVDHRHTVIAAQQGQAFDRRPAELPLVGADCRSAELSPGQGRQVGRSLDRAPAAPAGAGSRYRQLYRLPQPSSLTVAAVHAPALTPVRREAPGLLGSWAPGLLGSSVTRPRPRPRPCR